MDCASRLELDRTLLAGGYRLRRPIGRGGSAVVYEAERLCDAATVAIKVLSERHAADPLARARLFEEAAFGRELPRSCVARTLDLGTFADGSPYLVMERLQGESLAQLLLRSRALPWLEVAALGARLARVLHALHARGIVHRDLKPEHVWLTVRDPDALELRVLDFGVALRLSTPETAAVRGTSVFGTPGYLAPEQAMSQGAVDARADLYALGIVLFEASVGERPFKSSNAAVAMRRTIDEDVPMLGSRGATQLSPPFVAAVSRLCRREPARRFANARAAERALRLAAGGRAAEQSLARRIWRNDRLLGSPATLPTSAPTQALMLR